jgi:hypothetical protein
MKAEEARYGQSMGWVMWLSLLGTVFLGVVLRWILAGVAMPSGVVYAFVKNAHSHLGFFGLLFPLVWVIWREREGFFLSKRWSFFYLLGIVISTVGFLRAGYKFEAILGSTMVLAVWLYAAYRGRLWVKRWRDGLALAPYGILLASLCLPPVAFLTRRAPDQALLWVRSFLSLLIFLVFLPALLERLRWKMLPYPLWLVGGVAASAFLGIAPYGWLGMGLVILGGCVLWGLRERVREAFSSLRGVGRAAEGKGEGGERIAALPWDILVLWMAWAGGALALGMGLIPNHHLFGIASLHFTLLGVVLVTAWWSFYEQMPPSWLRYPYHAWLAWMLIAIVAQGYSAHPMAFLRSSAVAGTLLSIWLGFLALYAFFVMPHKQYTPHALASQERASPRALLTP